MGLVGEIDAGATANYHGMLLSLQRQAARGITVSGNYTWSHCISDYADLNSIGPDQAETYTDPNNRRFDRGNCNSDRRHIVNFTAVAETPQFSNATLRKIASAWPAEPSGSESGGHGGDDGMAIVPVRNDLGQTSDYSISSVCGSRTQRKKENPERLARLLGAIHRPGAVK